MVIYPCVHKCKKNIFILLYSPLDCSYLPISYCAVIGED